MKRELATRTLALSGLGWLLRKLKVWRGVLALAYHRIGEGAGSCFDRGLWSATPEAFAAQVRFLRKNFDVIVPEDLAAVAGKGRGRYALITFDDGYRDNYEQAFPILRSHGVGATFFITTGFLDRPRLPWWDEIAWMVRTSDRAALPPSAWLPGGVAFDKPDRERAIWALLHRYKGLPGEDTLAYLDFLAQATGRGRFPGTEAATWLTWDMVREMRGAGMCIGGHTVTHPVLARFPAERQAEEIAGCKQRIEAELGVPMTCLSYPVGGPDSFNDATRACLGAQNIEWAFSYYGGFAPFGTWDRHDFPRTAVENDVGRYLFQAMTSLPKVFA
jgi:peptidoglycan/xylan/chitin deacetylase (PgdA/CDA1 family)